MSTTLFTRADYMSTPLDGQPAAHRRYYAQLVTPAARAMVARSIGMKRLLASTDPHLNDIPLHRWDRIAGTRGLTYASMWQHLGDYPTLGGLVCVAKEAARLLVDEHRAARRLPLPIVQVYRAY